MNYVFERKSQLPPSGTEPFFLWGARQAGKTTLLRAIYPAAMWIDFLKAEEYRRYLQNPELLRGELAVRTSVRQVVIDEVQKVPAILDEVHWLLHNRGVQFALCGSARARSSEARRIFLADAECVMNCTASRRRKSAVTLTSPAF